MHKGPSRARGTRTKKARKAGGWRASSSSLVSRPRARTHRLPPLALAQPPRAPRCRATTLSRLRAAPIRRTEPAGLGAAAPWSLRPRPPLRRSRARVRPRPRHPPPARSQPGSQTSSQSYQGGSAPRRRVAGRVERVERRRPAEGHRPLAGAGVRGGWNAGCARACGAASVCVAREFPRASSA